MMKLKIVFVLCVFVYNLSYNQNAVHLNFTPTLEVDKSINLTEFDSLKINPNIVLPEDSLKASTLLASLNGFVMAAQANSQNDWILTTEIAETQILIDEFQDIQKSKWHLPNRLY